MKNMVRLSIAALAILAALGSGPARADAPASAESIMTAAKKQAKESKKPIFLVFGATW